CRSSFTAALLIEQGRSNLTKSRGNSNDAHGAYGSLDVARIAPFIPWSGSRDGSSCGPWPRGDSGRPEMGHILDRHRKKSKTPSDVRCAESWSGLRSREEMVRQHRESLRPLGRAFMRCAQSPDTIHFRRPCRQHVAEVSDWRRPEGE